MVGATALWSVHGDPTPIRHSEVPMNRSQLAVIVVILTIFVGVAAWSWVNIFHKPDYNPDVAHEFLEQFYLRCDARHGDEVCGDVVGDYHRQCFTGHLEYGPAEDGAERGPVLYDQQRYLDCMNEGVESVLSRDAR